MLNGISKSERIDRVIVGLMNDSDGVDVLASLAAIALRKMTEKEI